MVTQKFDLNMIPGKPKPIIRASQYDTGLRAFEVSLFAGTDTYTIPSGATLTVQGTKPDYTGFSYSATYSGNTVTFDCTDQMTACAGAVEMEIAVVNEGERVATANFVLQVEPAALKDDTIISETDIPIIEQLPEMMEDVNTLISTFGGPNVAETAAEMTDQDKVYVYIGSETGYNSGHWYYYDKTAHVWKDGGIYQSAGVEVDNTLSIGGMAADAKATGDALALKADIASPTFTGDPKAPTASLISYNTQIANTEFVQRLVLPLDDAVNGLEPTEIEMHLVVDGTTGTWAQGGKTNIYDLLPGDNVEVTAGERDAYLVWYTTQGGSEAVNVSTSHTVTAGATGRWGTTDARKLAVLMEDTSGNDVSPASFTINGVEKGLNERVDALETTKQDTLTFDTTPTEGSTNPVTSGGAWEAVQTDKTLAVEDKAADAKITGDAITELKSAFESATEEPENLIDLSKVVIGKNWTLSDAADRAIITIEVPNNITLYFDFTDISPFWSAQVIFKASATSRDSLGSVTLSNKGSFTVAQNVHAICVQFAKDGTVTASDFADLNVYIGYTQFNLTAKDTTARDSLDEISSDTRNIFESETLQVGRDWTGTTNQKRALIFANVLPNTEYTIDIPTSINIHQTNIFQKNTRGGSVIKSGELHFGKNTITTDSTVYCIVLQFSNFDNDFTQAMFEGYVPLGYAGTNGKTARDDFARSMNQWDGKKLVWLGTSIPAAGKYQIDNPISYPIMVGNMLNATVYNEAVGSSALHCKDPNRISASNPYGFLANFEAVSRCITNSLEEMEWIIEHYNDTNVFTQNVPASLSDADKEFIRSCSWEIKLQKYFTADDFPDAWIIDHGHNDIPSEASEATYTEKTGISGTQHDGWYSNGSFVESTLSSYIEFDVSNEIFVWISGTFGTGYDIYDIFDSDGNNIGHVRNGNEREVSGLAVNVANASILRVSNPNNLVSTIVVNKLKYPMYNSLYSYQGGFDFIVNKILSYNPKARIIMIGEYENQKYPTISENQIIAANRWEFPLYRQWENSGWSQQLILIDGEYKTMLNIAIPDNLHPHTDTTGKALLRLAKNIYGWLLTVA